MYINISLCFFSFRPKAKTMFHAPPLSAVDTAEAREHMISTQPEADDGDSPTFSRRDESPSGSFHILDIDQAKSASLMRGKSPESGETKEPLSPEKV
jgi:hypothetical protein